MANKAAATVLTKTAAQETQLSKHMAIVAVAAMIGVMFAGSTLLTPLYIIYKQRFGFSDITLTLIYAAYIVGNLGCSCSAACPTRSADAALRCRHWPSRCSAR